MASGQGAAIYHHHHHHNDTCTNSIESGRWGTEQLDRRNCLIWIIAFNAAIIELIALLYDSINVALHI